MLPMLIVWSWLFGGTGRAARQARPVGTSVAGVGLVVADGGPEGPAHAAKSVATTASAATSGPGHRPPAPRAVTRLAPAFLPRWAARSGQARALALRASNSSALIVPASSRALACAI